MVSWTITRRSSLGAALALSFGLAASSLGSGTSAYLLRTGPAPLRFEVPPSRTQHLTLPPAIKNPITVAASNAAPQTVGTDAVKTNAASFHPESANSITATNEPASPSPVKPAE